MQMKIRQSHLIENSLKILGKFKKIKSREIQILIELLTLWYDPINLF